MKSYTAFLNSLSEQDRINMQNDVFRRAIQENSDGFPSFTKDEMKLINVVFQAVAFGQSELMSRYHDWLIKQVQEEISRNVQ